MIRPIIILLFNPCHLNKILVCFVDFLQNTLITTCKVPSPRLFMLAVNVMLQHIYVHSLVKDFSRECFCLLIPSLT